MTRLDFITQPWFYQAAALFGGLILIMLVVVWAEALIAERRWPRIVIVVRERRRS